MASAESILAALDEEQRAVATAVRGPVCVIAGAGTGKTRAITHRLAYAVEIGIVEPNRILALTFTARAAGEMRSRLRSLGVRRLDIVSLVQYHKSHTLLQEHPDEIFAFRSHESIVADEKNCETIESQQSVHHTNVILCVLTRGREYADHCIESEFSRKMLWNLISVPVALNSWRSDH